MQRLGKNIGKYLGERIDIATVLRDVEAAAQRHGWKSETFLETPELHLIALRRPAPSPDAPRVYISTGIHGDEPAGPLAVRQLIQENRWPANVDLWLLPCLNPTGFPLNTRENWRGIDLNRQYRNPAPPDETRAHIAWLQKQPPFDLSLCLHEDWESNGFYVYELNPGNLPSLAPAIIRAVADVCPLDLSLQIEGWPASQGIIAPKFDIDARPDWPEALYLIANKSKYSYTLEAPSDFPLPTRVAAIVAGVNAALNACPGSN